MKVSDRARELISRSVVCDLTLPWGPANENKEKALPRWPAAGFTFVSLTLGMDWISLVDTMKNIGAERARFRAQEDRFILVETADDIIRAKKEGKTAIGFHFQGTNPMERDLGMVEVYYRLGIRHALLAYNEKNAVADGCHERTDEGLSRFGLELIAEMNRVGMLVDCTHTGYRSTMEAMEASRAPCIFSHSGPRALHDHGRNIRDDQIRACAKSGGVMGMNGVGFFLNSRNEATSDRFVDAIDYVAKLVGPQHVALGIDNVYYMDSMIARWRANPGRYTEGYPEPPWHFVQPEQLPEIVQVMIDRGYDDSSIAGILGGNFLRVAKAVWK